MGVSDVRQRVGWSPRAGGSASDLVPSKLPRPLIRPGTVCRPALIERLGRGDSRPIVSVVAPAGYGKTTLLSQWAERNGQAFAWVSVDAGDNDPKVLLSYVAEALDAVEPINERVFDALAFPASSVPGSVVPRLGSAFSSMTSPVVLVLDDVHVLRNSECRAALSVLADHMPGGSQLAFAGRAPPPLRIARLRAEGKITEIGPDDLSLTRGSAAPRRALVPGQRHARGGAGVLHGSRGRRWGRPPGGALVVPAYRRGRVTTIQRWFGWLEDRGGIGGHPMAAVLASLFSALMGRPVETERWADAVDRWQHGNPARPGDPTAEAWTALLRAMLCRRGVEQMRADADEAVRRFTVESFVTPTPALLQGVARILCGDLDGGEVSLEDAVSVGEQIGSPEHVAVGLCERSLVAMARSQWDQAEVLAGQARSVMRKAGIEESYATPLVSAVRARTAMHRADLPAVHQELARAQRLRHLLTYALPHFAVQARIELARVHLALTDQAGARTLMREVDDLLRRRPGLGTLAADAGALRAQLAKDRGSSVPGASALTAAELRLLPLLSTHLSFPQIAAEMFLSRYTIKSQAMSIYRRLGACSRSQAVARSRELGLLEG